MQRRFTWKLGVFGLPEEKESPLHWFVEGAARLGYGSIWRNPQHWLANEAESFDLVVVSGLHYRRAALITEYNNKNIPVIVNEQGYLKRDKYEQLSYKWLNQLWPTYCTDDRFKLLELDLADSMKSEGHILIADQKENDTQHNKTRQELNDYFIQSVLEIRKYTDRKIVYRPHPRILERDWIKFESGNIETHDPRKVPAWASLKKAYAVVTYNSNIGNEALLNGTHVFSYGQTSYSDLSNKSLSDIESPRVLTTEQRQLYFNRLAYSQWNKQEMESGEALAWLEFLFK